MSKVSTIYSAYIAEMQSVLKTSELLLQREKDGLDGELKTSGSMCEMFVKNLIKAHLPNHLRLTSGYILDSEKRNTDDNLAQFDLIIVDNIFPPIYKFTNLDIEVVPVESVCAVFEVKRSVNEKNIKKFIKKISDSVLRYKGLYKNIEYNPNIVNVSNLGRGINAPLIGIISLSSSLPENNVQINDKRNPNIVDFIWSIDGHIELPYKITNPGLTTGVKELSDVLCRPKNNSFENINENDWNTYINDGNRYLFMNDILQDKVFPEKICATAIGWLTYLLFRLRGRYGIDISEIVNDYYLKQH